MIRRVLQFQTLIFNNGTPYAYIDKKKFVILWTISHVIIYAISILQFFILYDIANN